MESNDDKKIPDIHIFADSSAAEIHIMVTDVTKLGLDIIKYLNETRSNGFLDHVVMYNALTYLLSLQRPETEIGVRSVRGAMATIANTFPEFEQMTDLGTWKRIDDLPAHAPGVYIHESHSIIEIS